MFSPKLFITLSVLALCSLLLGGCVSLRPAKSTGPLPAPTSPPTAQERDFRVARSRYGHKRYSEAIGLLKTFLDQYPQSLYQGQVLEMLGASYYQIGDCSQALETYQSLIYKVPEAATGQVYWQMGECCFATQNYEQALVHYQLVLDRYPQSVEQERLLYKIGLTSYHLGWFEQAQSSLLQVGGYRLSEEENFQMLFTRGRLALKLGDYRTAWQAPLDALALLGPSPSPSMSPLAEQAHSFLLDIIARELPNTELQQIMAAYPGKFPSDEALWRLIQMEVDAERPQVAQELLRHFFETFPSGHPRYAEASLLQTHLEGQLYVDSHKIGVIVPFSGKLASFGQRVLQGIQLAVEEENRRRETKLALIIKDSQGKSSLTAELLRELVEKERVIAVLGPVLSKATQVAAQVANELKIPLITPAASAPGIPQSGPYIFRNCLTAQQQAESIASFALEEMGLRTFAVLYPEEPYGQEMAGLFASIIENWGGRVMAKLSYLPEDTDFRSQIEYLHALSPQAVFLPDYYDKVVQIAPQLAFYTLEGEEGTLERLIQQLPPRPEEESLVPTKLLDTEPITFLLSPQAEAYKPQLPLPASPLEEEETGTKPPAPPKFFLLGTHGWYSPQLLQEGGRFLEGAVFACGFFEQNPSPLVHDFRKRFYQRFWQEPDLLAAQAYDCTQMLLEVLRQGARTREAVREGLIQVDEFAGVTGLSYFDEEGEIAKELVLVGIKRHRFQLLSGEEPWLHLASKASWAPLLREERLEDLLPWDLRHLLEPLELFELQPVEMEGESLLFD